MLKEKKSKNTDEEIVVGRKAWQKKMLQKVLLKIY